MKSDADAKAILVSIVVLTKNGGKYFRSLLDGLHRQEGIERAEVIVIDSGSTDDTLAILVDFPRVKLTEIPAREFGHGRTRNLGARLARGEYVVFLPQDATPVGCNWLADLLQPFDDSSVAGVYGRQIARTDASPMERFFLSRRYPTRPEIRALPPGDPASLERCFFSTVSGALRAEALRRFPFREDIIMSEDQAWAADVMRAGRRVAYQPAAQVLHSHQYRVGAVFRRNFDSGYSIRQIYGGRTGIGRGDAILGLLEEARFVGRTGSAQDLALFLPYEAARHAGFWLGLHAERLPVAWRRACGNLTYFWDR